LPRLPEAGAPGGSPVAPMPPALPSSIR
jgi:hypothetical protein